MGSILVSRNKKGHILSASDSAVVVAGASAATVSWWGPIVDGLPSAAQGIIVAGTVVFVIVRAVNEVTRFIRDWRNGGDR